MEINNKIKKYLTSGFNEQKIGVIKLVFVKKVIAPMVNRSDDSEDVITFRMPDQREVVAINSRKLKSKDKLFGLQLSRNNGGTLQDSKYNEMPEKKHISNINSILYGDTAVGDNAAGLKARCYYDWAYSVKEQIMITEIFQHNSITESGGIVATQNVGKQKKGDLRKNALFSTKYILPNSLFPHFITLTDCTEDMFTHALFTMLQSKAYGGQTTVQGNVTMENKLVAIIASKYEQPINSLVISQSYNHEDAKSVTEDELQKRMFKLLVDQYGDESLIIDEELSYIISEIENFYKGDEDKVRKFYEQTKHDSEEYFKQIGYFK